jgi:DNA-binding transcriptional MerR regulator
MSVAGVRASGDCVRVELGGRGGTGARVCRLRPTRVAEVEEPLVGERARDEEGFRGPQVCALVGITYRQLDYWARTGLVRPSLAEARGSGSQRRYSYRDLLELKVVKQLLDAGVSLQRARKALECLRSDLGVDVASASLVLAGPSSVLAHSDGEVVDLLRGGQGVLNIVALGPVVGALDAAIHAVRSPAGEPDPSIAAASDASVAAS